MGCKLKHKKVFCTLKFGSNKQTCYNMLKCVVPVVSVPSACIMSSRLVVPKKIDHIIRGAESDLICTYVIMFDSG